MSIITISAERRGLQRRGRGHLPVHPHIRRLPKETNFAVSTTGTRQITVAPGLAWINYDDFKGVSVCSREENVLTVPEADNTLNRVDRVVVTV